MLKLFKKCAKQLIKNNAFLWRHYSRWYWLKRTPKITQKPKKYLRFDVHLAEHCNLKCLGCEHYSPLAEEEYLDIDDFSKDCKRLSKLTNGIVSEICLLGGEPLLNPNVAAYTDIARSYFPKASIKIVTNGILLPKQPLLFWQKCHANNIEVNVSIYPIKIDIEKITSLAEANNVLVTYCNIEYLDWVCRPMDLQGKQNITKVTKMCYQLNQCIQLVNGKLFTCARIAYIRHFNKFFNQNLIVTNDDYIDIYKADSIEEILSFLNKPVPFCKYCNLKKTIIDMKWAPSKKNITEWTNPQRD
jgi:organic radical activating enzyme